MTRLVRWEPFREMVSIRDMMDRFIEDSFGTARGSFDGEGFMSPPVDMYQTDDDVIVKATLPGFKPEEINISVTGDTLSLRGETTAESEVKEATYHMRERRFGSFSRSLRLPSAVVAERAKADFENGILTLTLPKAEEVKPKTISLKAK
ncbi:MAG TPA: Hsp20/alpha crystallin family protein [Anaerolineales bacterium]|nr:Hsp20/alpha crystallin family protein [Anaerolineales bacterium]